MATTWTKTGARSGQASQATTETAPTGAIGVDLDQVESLTVVFHAPAGQSFSGTGNMLAYKQLAGIWARAPRADLDMADFTGLTDAAPPSLHIESPTGRFLYVPSSVAISGGSAITTDYVCTLRTGAQS